MVGSNDDEVENVSTEKDIIVSTTFCCRSL